MDLRTTGDQVKKKVGEVLRQCVYDLPAFLLIYNLLSIDFTYFNNDMYNRGMN